MSLRASCSALRWGARRTFVTLSCAVALAIVAPAAALAATYTVTTTADGNHGSCTLTLCSFRDALNAADSAAGSTVVVPAGTYKATMTSGNGDFSPTGSYTIQGAGAGQTIIDGNGLDRVFAFYGQITVTGVTVTGGQGPFAGCECGGAFEVRQGGFLTLIDSAVQGNTAPGGGGGIDVDSQSKAILQNVAVTSNSAPANGGGIHVGPASGNTGTLVMNNVTISGNMTSGSAVGAGLDNQGLTRGTNVTVAGNVSQLASGAITNETGGNLSLTNATIATNNAGVGVFNKATAGAVTLRNTIVADGCGGPAAPFVFSAGHNLDAGATCGFGSLGDISNRAPLLGPLANTGTTGLQTLALLGGSPAIDAGDNSSCPATDERGVSRPQGALCDIGAVEYAGPVVTLAPATAPSTTGATVNGSVNPNLRDTVYSFRYGTTTAYGGSTSSVDAGAGGAPVAVKAVLAGLAPATTYHYQLVATNSDGTSTTGDATFTTAGTPPPPPKSKPPALTQVSQSASRWKVGHALPRISRVAKVPTGTTFKFRLNENARVTLSFTQTVTGRRSGGVCVRRTAKNRHKARCTLALRRGAFAFSGHAGANRVVFQGRVSSKLTLAPGTYTVTLTVINSAHQQGTPKRLVFTIVKK